MAIGLRAADGPKIHRLCGEDRRLFMRIGNLMQAGITVSEAVLAEAGRLDWLRSLLMHRGLREVAPAGFSDFATGFDPGAEELLLVEEAGEARTWRVLAWTDEVDNPLLEAAAGPAEDRNLEGLRSVLPTATLDCRMTIEALLDADSDEERAAALEKLRYHLPPPEVLMELLPLVLADSAEVVRARAHNLLAASGARPPVIELIRCLQEDDEIGIRAVFDPLSKLPPEQALLALEAVIAHLGRGTLNQTVVDLCAAHAQQLLSLPRLEHCLELLYAHCQAVSLVPLIRRLQAADHQRIDACLRGLLGQSDEGDTRLLAALLVEGGYCDADDAERALDLLLAGGHVPRDRMGLAAALVRIGNREEVLVRLVARRREIPSCPDPAALWLIGTYCRAGLVDSAAADALAASILDICMEGDTQQLTAVLEQQLLRLLPATPEKLARSVEPLGELATRTRDARNLSVIEHNLCGLPMAAAEPLWRLLEEHPHANARRVAVTALAPVLAAADADTLIPAVERALADLPARPDAGGHFASLLALAARLADLPGLDEDPGPARAVDHRAEDAGIHAVEAWGHLVAGPHLPLARRSELITILLRLLTHRIEEDHTQEVEEEGEDTPLYVLDRALSRHTEWVPEILAALHIISASPHLPGPLLRQILDALIAQFGEVAGWKAVWAPGNVMDLATALTDIALVPGCPRGLRSEALKALRPHLRNPTIATHTARIANVADNPHLAGSLATELVDHLVNERMADEDQHAVANAAVAFLAVPDLGEHDERLRRQLATVLARLQAHLTGRSREQLLELLPDLDEDVRRRLEWLYT